MLYHILKAVLGPVFRFFYAPTISGADNIPKTGPVIVAGNHLALCDCVFFPMQVERPITFLGKSEYFQGRGLWGRIVAWVIKGVGVVPVDRRGGKKADAALRTGLAALSEGKVLGVYPEGTRSPDGRLYRGKTGVARLALTANVPVIPVAMCGSFQAQPPGYWLPKFSPRVHVAIGEPLYFKHVPMHDPSYEELRAATDQIMAAIQALSGQEYVNKYAIEEKQRLRESGKL